PQLPMLRTYFDEASSCHPAPVFENVAPPASGAQAWQSNLEWGGAVWVMMMSFSASPCLYDCLNTMPVYTSPVKGKPDLSAPSFSASSLVRFQLQLFFVASQP